jgi:DNA-binding protein H-NS
MCLRPVRSVFNDEKKLSIAALSEMLPRTAHRTDYAVIGHQLLELLAGVLAATVGMMQLMNLRRQVDERLLEHRAEIQTQLQRMDGAIAHITGPRGKVRASSLRGRKVPPKYRSPSGETWAGRGARPRWLAIALKRGKKIEDFLIDKSSVSPSLMEALNFKG